MSDLMRKAVEAYGRRGTKGSLSEQLHQKRADRKECFVSGYLAAHGTDTGAERRDELQGGEREP